MALGRCEAGEDWEATDGNYSLTGDTSSAGSTHTTMNEIVKTHIDSATLHAAEQTNWWHLNNFTQENISLNNRAWEPSHHCCSAGWRVITTLLGSLKCLCTRTITLRVSEQSMSIKIFLSSDQSEARSLCWTTLTRSESTGIWTLYPELPGTEQLN